MRGAIGEVRKANGTVSIVTKLVGYKHSSPIVHLTSFFKMSETTETTILTNGSVDDNTLNLMMDLLEAKKLADEARHEADKYDKLRRQSWKRYYNVIERVKELEVKMEHYTAKKRKRVDSFEYSIKTKK